MYPKCPNPTGELTALLQALGWISGAASGQGRRGTGGEAKYMQRDKGKGRGREGEER